MGTSLLPMGLPAGASADGWLDERPHAIIAVHRGFVEAGARVHRTATLCVRPDQGRGTARHWSKGVALAREAGAPEVWLSIGPAGPQRGPIQGLAAAVEQGADALVLETFVDPIELLEAVALLHHSGAPRIVASLVPGARGLLGGGPYPAAELRAAGAHVLGLNCGSSPSDVAETFPLVRDDGPWWLAPCDGPTLPHVLASLQPQVAYLGGCCGVGPGRHRVAWPR